MKRTYLVIKSSVMFGDDVTAFSNKKNALKEFKRLKNIESLKRKFYNETGCAVRLEVIE